MAPANLHWHIDRNVYMHTHTEGKKEGRRDGEREGRGKEKQTERGVEFFKRIIYLFIYPGINL